jgi:hypothetical protein
MDQAESSVCNFLSMTVLLVALLSRAIELRYLLLRARIDKNRWKDVDITA